MHPPEWPILSAYRWCAVPLWQDNSRLLSVPLPRCALAFLFSKGHKVLVFCFARSVASGFQLSALRGGGDKRSGSSVQTSAAGASPVPPRSCPETSAWFAYSWWEIRGALSQGAAILLQLATLCITKLKIVWNQLGGEKKSMPGFSGWKGKIATQLSTGTHFPHSSCHVLPILCLGCSSEIIKLSPMGNNYLLKIFE